MNRYKNSAWLYYTRNSYKIDFFNCSGIEQAELLYEQSMSGIAASVGTPNKPDGVDSDYIFGGWYTSPACETGTEVNWNSTMPAHNLQVYAKWVKPQYTVSFNTNGGIGTILQ